MFPTGRCGHHIVAPQNKSQLGSTHRHAPTRKSPIHMGHNPGRVPSTTMCANRAKMLAVMAAGPATPMRSQIQQRHKSLNVLTRHPGQKSLDSPSSPFFCTPFIVATTSWPRQANLVTHIVALPRWNLRAKDCVGRLTSNIYADRLDTFATNTPIRKKTPTITHIESRTHQNGNLQTLETQIARLGMKNILQPRAVETTSRRLKIEANLVAQIVTLQRVNLQYTYATTLVAFISTRNLASREKRLAIMANEHSIRTPYPLQQEQKSNHALTTHLHGNPRTCRSQTAGLVMPTTCTTKRSGDLFVVTVVLCHIGGTPSRGPALEYALFMARTALVAFCGSLGHVSQSRRPGQRTPMQENTLTTTHTSNELVTRTEIHTHTKHKSVSWAKISQSGAVQTQRDVSKQKTTWWHAIARSKTGVSNTREQQRWTCPFLQNSRVSLQKSWQIWRLDQPLQSHPKINTNTNPRV